MYYNKCRGINEEIVDENCLSVENDGDCQFCKKGYFLNPD